MIENGEVPFVEHTSFKDALQWCEGFYTIDFKKNVFISKFHSESTTFNLDDLPTEDEYLKSFKSK